MSHISDIVMKHLGDLEIKITESLKITDMIKQLETESKITENKAAYIKFQTQERLDLLEAFIKGAGLMVNVEERSWDYGYGDVGHQEYMVFGLPCAAKEELWLDEGLDGVKDGEIQLELKRLLDV